MFGSVLAVGATAARFAAVNAGPIGVRVGRYAAASLVVAAAADTLAAVGRRRETVKKQMAEQAPEAAPRPTAAESLRKARATWKATPRAAKRARVRQSIRTVGRVVRRTPKAVWTGLVRATRWARNVLVAEAFGFVTVTLAAAWLALYTLNAVLMYVITATVGVTAAGLTYVFNRPFSDNADALARANRAFLIYEPVYLNIRSLLHAAVLSPMRFAKDKWFSRNGAKSDVTETVAPVADVDPSEEELTASVNNAFIKTHLNVRVDELKKAPHTHGGKVFAEFVAFPEVQDEAYTAYSAELDSLVASSAISPRHRQQALAGFSEARRRQHPQAS